MDDEQIRSRIGELVAEEHRLRGQGAGLSEDERTRLRGMEEQLDQCWDLLRQRQARARSDQDPDGASARPVDEVESYQQ